MSTSIAAADRFHIPEPGMNLGVQSQRNATRRLYKPSRALAARVVATHPREGRHEAHRSWKGHPRGRVSGGLDGACQALYRFSDIRHWPADIRRSFFLIYAADHATTIWQQAANEEQAT